MYLHIISASETMNTIPLLTIFVAHCFLSSWLLASNERAYMEYMDIPVTNLTFVNTQILIASPNTLQAGGYWLNSTQHAKHQVICEILAGRCVNVFNSLFEVIYQNNIT